MAKSLDDLPVMDIDEIGKIEVKTRIPVFELAIITRSRVSDELVVKELLGVFGRHVPKTDGGFPAMIHAGKPFQDSQGAYVMRGMGVASYHVSNIKSYEIVGTCEQREIPKDSK